ncbi:malto-oligosyltrehalose trehalohydrolase [Desulfurivibrio alkaliphilus]|uniref:Malto-oligosyltrehalose trehalohydrolase n=1 Tax=Desulfurivibrio alkaliphilus (strain DSM 19089 / UNIQEM U267 / AHT2) TaxID=589865 RepID=D6Z0F3_DESAT|nr:malto-oligosyltrehalose trehalohydrolase [Desulfurivibrio alkaliphilus]ADH85182.1 malto-oligosyltrehalose trehalohydrolase [Desulfurivibrio alkaliphilus AHT 2]
MMQRCYDTPFGAACLPGGGVRFRLWAPAAKKVELCRLAGPTTAAAHSEEMFNLHSAWWRESIAGGDLVEVAVMQTVGEGWFELVAPRAAAGDFYCYQIDGDLLVPDPASRCQPGGVHGPSLVIDPAAWPWQDRQWPGRPWEEAVLYELHVGCFTPEGTWAAVEPRLDYLAELGVTALSLMPLATFPGQRNWGYDGVLPFAPASPYGEPAALKSLVQSAHARGLMVLLDVVYNHFGPEGNYLHAYAPQFFTRRHRTPWGEAINFDGRESHWVRRFFIDNALYWLLEYNFDGLRLDAVHAIYDDSQPHFLQELAAEVARCCEPPAVDDKSASYRPRHLILENDANQARFLAPAAARSPLAAPPGERSPCHYTAQWNDDWHHAAHVLLTGEKEGYYVDYADQPLAHLGRCLSEGFAYQGEPSPFRVGLRRGEPSRALPATALVNFLQNHDQIGNRALGERLTALAPPAPLRALTAILLLAPSPPLLFMGQEWGAATPFLFFADFGPELAQQVTEGRRHEFAAFPAFATPEQQHLIPDPADPATFTASKLAWEEQQNPDHQAWLTLHRNLLALRHREIIPLLPHLAPGAAEYKIFGASALQVSWPLVGKQNLLVLQANLGDVTAGVPEMAGRQLFNLADCGEPGRLPTWSVCWLVV